MESRRRTQRFTLLQPLAARAETQRAYVVDVSISGVRLSHPSLLPDRKPCAISLELPDGPITFTAERRWTAQSAGEFQSGFEIQAIDEASSNALRRLVQQSAGPIYICHRLVHGVWRKTNTTDPAQPADGFTVMATETANTVDFFRAAYTKGNRDLRERIRRLAALSIEHPERHYDA